jgi:hypothetical protein
MLIGPQRADNFFAISYVIEKMIGARRLEFLTSTVSIAV